MGRGLILPMNLAYHVNKFERGFDRAIDIFGADHHGYLRACGRVESMRH